jgi:glycolate oxidase iron-sulfur subunit
MAVWRLAVSLEASEMDGREAEPQGRDAIDDCVHCGFCLPHCPTYRLWGEEMDSPRGRIYLMRGLRDGDLRLTPEIGAHFDRCLGCMACMPACPSGVRYDLLIERTRAGLERGLQRGLFDRLHRMLVFALFPYPRRLRMALVVLWIYVRTGLQALVRRSGLLRRLPPRLAQLDALMPEVHFHHLVSSLPAHVPAQGKQRARVGLIAGCVQRAFFPGVNEATLRVLSAEGCDVRIPRRQGCCGALSLHSGRADEARDFARALIQKFEREPFDAIVVNAAGCGSNLKSYPALFAGDPAWEERARAFTAKVRDVTELLASLTPAAARNPLPARVAYHDACHLAHAQGIRIQPRALLRAIPGLELVEIADGEQCCGSAGTYNLMEPEAADQIGERKVNHLLETGAELLATANPGCTLQIQKLLRARGLRMAAAHPVEIIDASIRGAPLDSLVTGVNGKGAAP